MLHIEKEAVNRVAGLVYRQVVLYMRHIDRKLEIFFWPTIDAILFGAIGTYAAKQGSSTTLVFILVGFVMAQLVWQSHIHLSKFFLQEVWDRNVLYMMTRPVRTGELMTAAAGLTGVIALSAVLFIAVVIAALFGLHILEIPLLVLVLIPILMVLGWSTALLATSLLLLMGQKADNFVWALFALIGPLSGSIVPVDNLPPGIRDFALLLPTTHAYEAGRKIVFAHVVPWANLVAAGLGGIAMFALSMRILSASMQRFRKKGFISRYV